MPKAAAEQNHELLRIGAVSVCRASRVEGWATERA
jgi:hypothetical protein